jgi:hypothetical protein
MLDLESFTSGLLAALCLEGQQTLLRVRWDEGLAAAFQELITKQPKVEPEFRIRIDRVHGNSANAFSALHHAVTAGLVAISFPDRSHIHLKLDQDWAIHILKQIDGGIQRYRPLAKAYLIAAHIDSK